MKSADDPFPNEDFVSVFQKFFRLIPAKFLTVSIKTQTLTLFENETAVLVYPVSSSKYGVGCRMNSRMTPYGMHAVYAKIGEGAAPGSVFKARVYTGENIYTTVFPENTDVISSRIIWLTGLEEGVNLGGENDSKTRCIYIHGTNHEELIGTPASQGCIRMKNTDVIHLFDRVSEDMPVLIM